MLPLQSYLRMMEHYSPYTCQYHLCYIVILQGNFLIINMTILLNKNTMCMCIHAYNYCCNYRKIPYRKKQGCYNLVVTILLQPCNNFGIEIVTTLLQGCESFKQNK